MFTLGRYVHILRGQDVNCYWLVFQLQPLCSCSGGLWTFPFPLKTILIIRLLFFINPFKQVTLPIFKFWTLPKLPSLVWCILCSSEPMNKTDGGERERASMFKILISYKIGAMNHYRHTSNLWHICNINMQYWNKKQWYWMYLWLQSFVVSHSYIDGKAPDPIYYYHHSIKLYKIFCCCLYCYECVAWVTMPIATNNWYFFQYSYGNNNFMVKKLIAH